MLPLAGAVGVLLCLAGLCLSWLGMAPQDRIGGPFALLDPDGHVRGASGFPGRYELIFFGYTSCADFCPRTLSDMSEALDRLDPDAARIQPLFITVDPRRDTPDRLRRYTAKFSSHLIGLTGPQGVIDDVRRTFHVVVEDETPRPGLDHTAVLFLLDPHGHLATVIPAASGREAIGAALRAYVEPMPG